MLKLGFRVAQSTVAKYMPKRDKPPSVTWRTFLKNQARQIVACDFFTVLTLTFSVLYVFIALRHSDRRLLHVAVTTHPTSAWVAQQMREAFPPGEVPQHLLRDNDRIYGNVFSRTVRNMGIEEVRTAWHSPWQNPYCERAIGSIRRECLDLMIPLNARHLRRALRHYARYYNQSRTHLGLQKDSPESRAIESPEFGGQIVAIPQVDGLHHRYTRMAA